MQAENQLALPEQSCMEELALVSFVIPVRNDRIRLERCLSGLADLDCNGIRIEIIVGDNGSSDGSREAAQRAGARVFDLPSLSVAQIRNRAASAAQGQIIAFIDADHVVAPDWLKPSLEVFSDPQVAAAGAPYLPPDDPTWVQCAYDRFRRRPKVRCDAEWLGSGNLLMRRSAFMAVGGFDESLETCEDVDLCQRLRRAGWRLVSEPGMRSIHFGDPPTLRSVFMSELWRGRDNIRVTLRGPATVRSLASLLIPATNLLLFLVILGASIAIITRPQLWPLILASASAFLSLCIVRVTRMAQENDGFKDIGRNLAVASVYECARAFALVIRATHATRRKC
jgi:GT2 family glycosyltransferase